MSRWWAFPRPPGKQRWPDRTLRRRCYCLGVDNPRRDEIEAFAAAVKQAQTELAPRFPDIDPGDLMLILEQLLRPADWPRRQIFLRPLAPGIHAP